MIFEWDKQKAKENLRKHKISFETASQVFNDPRRIDLFDEAHSSINEFRYNTIGMVHKILFVVYTDRFSSDGEEVTRIISARPAQGDEIYEYLNQIYE